MNELVDAFFEHDSGLLVRLFLLFIAILMICRALELTSEIPPTSTDPSSAAPNPASGSTWFWWANKTEKLRAATEEARVETDFLLSETQKAEASQSLAEARARLQATMNEISAASGAQTARPTASLRLDEIINIIALADLEPEDRNQLQQLFIAALAEKAA